MVTPTCSTTIMIITMIMIMIIIMISRMRIQSMAPMKVVKELKEGDHGDPDLLDHLNKVLDQSIHATGLLFKV